MMFPHCTRFLLLAATLLACPSYADTLQGRVVAVTDGDTVTVLDADNTQFKIRLMGIDAPEKKQAFGSKSKESLSSLVFNKQVTIEYSKHDRYGRTIGKIIVDGVDANLEQVKVGMAWHGTASIALLIPRDLLCSMVYTAFLFFLSQHTIFSKVLRLIIGSAHSKGKRMNFRIALIVIVSALFASGCSVSGKYRGDGPCKGFHKDPQICERAHESSLVAGKVKIGQSLAEVRAIMGHDPEQREATADTEEWSYLTDYTDNIIMVIVFKQGIVTQIKQSSVSKLND